MRRPFLLSLAAAGALFLLGPSLRAETTVTLKGVHLCCGACVRTVGNVLKDAGVTGKCDRKGKTVTITAADAKAAQKAVDALAAAGFHGTSDNKNVKVKDDSGAKAGKVKSLTLTGTHNCCRGCCVAIKKTVSGVKGVESDDAKPKGKTFTVTGNFDAAELVKALNKAGFHVKVK
jgi:mercuric ion binding protein